LSNELHAAAETRARKIAWYSRFVVSWELDQTLEIELFVLLAVGRALAQATPEIMNSDQSSYFTSPQSNSFEESLLMSKENELRIFMTKIHTVGSYWDR